MANITKQVEKNKEEAVQCEEKCYRHGSLSVRGRKFKGFVRKIVGQRAVIEWERIIFVQKFERFMKKKSKLHAHIPKCLMNEVSLGNYVEVGECRPLSKITHFVLLGVIRQ